MSSLKLFTFGPPRLELDGQPVVLDRNKDAALLVYLAVTGQPHSRLSLATLLWPEHDQSQALAYLRRALWALNDTLGEGWLDADRENVTIRAGADLWLDAQQFEQALALCERHGHPKGHACHQCLPLLERAAELYSDDFLAGFSLRDSPAFDDWQFFQGENLRAQLAGTLQRLADCYGEQRQWEPAIQSARRWLSLDPLREEAHRHLMVLYAQAGQRSAALRQFEECARILQAELGVEPEAETQALYTRLKSGQLTRETGVSVPSAAPGERQVRLPAPPTPFVGREEELDEITGLLHDSQCRLLSLVGPGGIGKTRLAIEAASRLALTTNGNAPGVYFVPVAPLSSVESLVPAIGDVLGLSFRREEVLGVELESKTNQLIDYLRPREVLLVLDNFEHLVSGADLLEDLVTAAPELTILVTSRERLNLPGEWVLQVGSMRYPAETGAELLETYSAVDLFLQCARRARVGFELSVQEQPWVVRICQLVEGFPLGIELAAAWVKMLTCQEIAAEIQRSLDFLAAQRGLPDRHQSLRAVFMHSWELLSEMEKCAFSRLSVFRGPFRRQAAEAVLDCAPLPDGGDDRGLSSALVLGLLAALVDKSLLRRASDGRYEMHELLKQYAAEMLEKNPTELKLARDQHSAYYKAALDRLASDLTGAGLPSALRWIEGEFEDIRAAWRWALSQGELPAVVQMGNLLSRYYIISNRFQEAAQDYGFVLSQLEYVDRQAHPSAASSELSNLVRAYALAWSWNFRVAMGEDREAHRQADRTFETDKSPVDRSPSERVEAYRQEALALADRLPGEDRATLYLITRFGAGLLDEGQVAAHYRFSLDTFVANGARWDQAYACLVYGGILEFQDFESSMQLYEEGLELSRQVGDPWLISVALLSLAQTLYFSRGSYDRAQALLLEALQIARLLGDSWLVIGDLIWLGQVSTAQGKYEPAVVYYQECLDMVREKGDRGMVAVLLACLGHAQYLMEEYVEAWQAFLESLEICRATGDEHEMGMAYGNLGNVARALGEYEQAREHYLRSVDLLERTGERWGLCLNLKRLGNLYSELGEFDAAWGSYRQALQLAQRQDLPAEMLDILLGIAGILTRQDDPERAVELASLALAHTATAMDARENAVYLLGQIEGRLPEENFEAARQRGRSMDLRMVAEGVLVELSEQGGDASKHKTDDGVAD